MKKLLTWLLLATLAFALIGCAPTETPAATTEAPVETTTVAATTEAATTEPTTEAEEAYYPVTIGNYNRAKEEIAITFDKAPERVVAVYQDSVETMLALGLEDRVVGFAGLDEDVKPEYAAAFAKAPLLDAWSPDKETVLALEPDMILSWYSFFDDKKMGDVDFWHERNVGTYMMRNSGASPERSVENEYIDILTLGTIFNVEDKAEAIVENMKAEVAKILEIANKMDKKPSVLVMEFDKKGVRVYGENTLAGDMVKTIGADLVTAPENRMTGEELITKNPDVIFNVYFGSSSAQEDAAAAIAKLMDDPTYASLDAVKNGRVYAISLSETYCSGTRTLDGIIKLAKGTYPEFAAAQQAAADAAHYPVTIKNFNRAKEEIDITFDKAPEKVVAVYQDSVETMLALGLEDRVVGFAGLDEDVKPEYAAAFAKAPLLDAWSPDKETVLALEPDMILSWYSFFGDKKMGDVDFWHERNVGTYMMRNSGAAPERSVENEYIDILTLGKIFNVEDRAEAIVSKMKAEVAKILEIANSMEQKPSVLVMEFDKKGVRVYGENTLAGDMVKTIGADLVTAPENRMTGEELITKNPDVIFNVYFGSSSAQEDAAAAIAKLMDDPTYASLDAVKNGRVYAISLSETYCSGTRTLDGIIKLAKGTYPEFEE